MSDVNNTCPKCQSIYIYEDGNLWICPECSYEWLSFEGEASPLQEHDASVKDAHGNILNDGDTVIVIKDLKIKGSSSSIKGGTKIKGIRVEDMGDGHNFSGKVEGFGTLNLKSEFVKKQF